MSNLNQNSRGQGISHAVGDSKVPSTVQHKTPQGFEERLPESVCYPEVRIAICLTVAHIRQVHPTGTKSGDSTMKTHAKDGGKASVVPQKLQEILPESVERAVPNVIHDTGDTGGLHRKK